MEQRTFHKVIYEKYKGTNNIELTISGMRPLNDLNGSTTDAGTGIIRVLAYDDLNGHNGRFVRHYSGLEHVHRSTILADAAYCTLLYATVSILYCVVYTVYCTLQVHK